MKILLVYILSGNRKQKAFIFVGREVCRQCMAFKSC